MSGHPPVPPVPPTAPPIPTPPGPVVPPAPVAVPLPVVLPAWPPFGPPPLPPLPPKGVRPDWSVQASPSKPATKKAATSLDILRIGSSMCLAIQQSACRVPRPDYWADSHATTWISMQCRLRILRDTRRRGPQNVSGWLVPPVAGVSDRKLRSPSRPHTRPGDRELGRSGLTQSGSQTPTGRNW